MAKVSKQDKIKVYQFGYSYGISVIEISQRYQVGQSNTSFDWTVKV